MSLYLKYRPQKIEELDLPQVREFLRGLVKSQRVGHAYLFEGPRGAGKTSTARILAKMLNCAACGEKLICEPCGKCGACERIAQGRAVDIVEIDGASNRRIDDIRNLKQKIGLAPAVLRKKVYIIDEVHMLTMEAFNALLKTLEEPPSHAVFVLATTEGQKVPETIVSRCIRVSFRKANKEELIRALQRVVKGEGLEVEEGVLEVIAGGVDGSFRDGVKVLEQVVSEAGGGQIKRELVERLLYGSVGFEVEKFLELLVEREVEKAIAEARRFVRGGGEVKFLLSKVLWFLKESLLAGVGVGGTAGKAELGARLGVEEGMRLAELLAETYKKVDEGIGEPAIWLELMIVKWGRREGRKRGSGFNSTQSEESEKRRKEDEKRERVKQQRENGKKKLEASELESGWKRLVREAGKYYSLGALLSTARIAGQEEGELVIEVKYDFHKQQLEQEKYLAKVEELVREVFEVPLRVRVRVGRRREVGGVRKEGGDDLETFAEELFLGK